MKENRTVLFETGRLKIFALDRSICPSKGKKAKKKKKKLTNFNEILLRRIRNL